MIWYLYNIEVNVAETISGRSMTNNKSAFIILYFKQQKAIISSNESM